ncbi:MAG TPA: phospholipid carrier-dependent glycosyltransferase [Chloroflexota bacterium]
MLAEDHAPPALPLAAELPASRLQTLVRGLAEREWLVIVLLAAWAIFILFWRLDDPPKYIYDEVYHAFTGNLMAHNDPKVYEWWQSAQSLPNPIEGTQYEWTHPPLGKLIIGGSIWLFGNNSVGWRFSNAVFGVICVLLTYLLTRLLFRDRLLATLAAGIISVEGLMFAESRIGTNDIFQLAFLLAAYACFAAFLRRPARHAIGWLFATGLFLGLGVATKWPSIYSIILLTAIAVIRGFWPESPRPRQRERDREREPEPTIQEFPPQPSAPALIEEERAALLASKPPSWPILSRFGYLLVTPIAMLVIPAALYVASYIQMFLEPHQIPSEYAQVGPLTVAGHTLIGAKTLPDSNWWSMFVGEQWQMWHYHTTLSAGHPYYSKWWQWLLDIRPVFYYVDRQNDYVANTYNLGNPILYWGFPVAIVLGAWLIWKKRDPWLALVLAAFLVNWAPWALSPRGLFFYHFLPSVPFLVLLVAHCAAWLWRQPNPKWRRAAAIYVALIFFSFAFFYTQLAAWPVPEWYADLHYWLPSWQ